MTIDSDAHVVESEVTWTYCDPADRAVMPRTVEPGDGRRYWFIDGKIRGLARFVLTDETFGRMQSQARRAMVTPEETREAENIPARLKHMDQLGVGQQVLYPTIFLEQVADNPAIEVALTRAYNRWLADIYAQSQARLPWICVLPLLSMEESLAELQQARRQGAVGVFMRGVEGPRFMPDEYFDPLFSAATDLDMCIGVHVGNANRWMVDMLNQNNPSGPFWVFRLSTIGAFHAAIMAGLPHRHPKLRVGFIEASAGWLPYILSDLRRRLPGRGKGDLPEHPLEDYRMYVTCQTDDDVPYLLHTVGEENLLIGTDYGHNDQSTELDSLLSLRDSGGVTPEQYRKITEANPKALYGLA
ncbi:MAG: amidohydrolase family protein [Chloroflexi bacterium]|nr:amidohydrolase family protein [Chloroflexota bacterium]